MAGLRDDYTGQYMILPGEKDFELVIGRDPSPQCHIAVPIHKERETKTVGEIASEMNSIVGSQILIEHPRISGEHATIVRVDGVDYLVDNESTNGTRIKHNDGGEPVTVGEEPVRLTGLDRIMLSGYPVVYFGLDEDSDEFREYARHYGVGKMFRMVEEGE